MPVDLSQGDKMNRLFYRCSMGLSFVFVRVTA